MPVGVSAYIPLATITLGSSSSSVTFSSIPATYRDLVLVINGTTTVGANLRLRINSDTGANYNRAVFAGDGSVTYSIAQAAINQINLDSFGFFDTTIGTTIAQFLDYSATDKHKTVLSRANNTTNGVSSMVGRYASTSAITSLNTFPSAGSYATGTTFNLYAIAS
jgi:hypothetical protein